MINVDLVKILQIFDGGFMKEFRDKLIQDLYNLNVRADITIEELADDIIDDIQNIVGREYVELFGSCPMCMDCPDGCPLDR